MTPVYVINLKRSADRRAWMEAELARAGVAAEFVAAVDGRRFSDRCAAAQLARHALSRAETAAAMSHRKAWRKLLASDAPFAAIFEDDVHLGANVRETLELDWARLDFDAVKLETLLDKVWLTRRGFAAGQRELRRLGAEHLGAAAYIVSRRGARKLLEDTQTIDAAPDHPLFGRRAVCAGRIRAFQLVPAIAVQDNLFPDPSRRLELPTTLHEAERARLTDKAKRNKPRGLARVRRELARLFDQAQRWVRLAPTMRRMVVPFE